MAVEVLEPTTPSGNYFPTKPLKIIKLTFRLQLRIASSEDDLSYFSTGRCLKKSNFYDIETVILWLNNMYFHCTLKLVVLIRGYYEAICVIWTWSWNFYFWLEPFVCVVVSGACKIAPLSCFSHSGKNSDQSNIIASLVATLGYQIISKSFLLWKVR